MVCSSNFILCCWIKFNVLLMWYILSAIRVSIGTSRHGKVYMEGLQASYFVSLVISSAVIIEGYFNRNIV